MFHDRWSKKVMLPRDDQWGRGASSVAQCMVWDYGYPKKPATQQVRNDTNNNNRSRQGQRYKPRTTVKFEPKLEDTATSRISGELHAERVAAVRAPTSVTSNTQPLVKHPSTPIQAWGVASPTLRGDVVFGKGSINENGLVAAMKDYARHTPGGTVLSDFYAAPRPPTEHQQRAESRTGGQPETFSNARFVRLKSSGASRPSSAPIIRHPPPNNRNTTTQNDYAVQRVQMQQYRPPFRPAGGAHFAKWRPLTPPSTPEARNWWRMSKFTKNANPKISTFWENRTNGATGPIKVRQLGPRQVNFTMECPEESDMIVSIRLRTASSQN